MKSNDSLVVRVEAWIWALLTDSSSETSSILIHNMSSVFWHQGTIITVPKWHTQHHSLLTLYHAHIVPVVCALNHNEEGLKGNSQITDPIHIIEDALNVRNTTKITQFRLTEREPTATFESTYLYSSNIITFRMGEFNFNIHFSRVINWQLSVHILLIYIFFLIFAHLWYVYSDYFG